MQPYFLPYVGYWQLLNAVDEFILLDDAQYITRGWVNRNKIVIGNKEHWMTIPLVGASKNKYINDIEIVPFDQWLPKLRRKLEIEYKKAPYFKEGLQCFDEITNSRLLNLSEFLLHSINTVNELLGIETIVRVASEISPRGNLAGESRIISICKSEGASIYINPIGGKELYEATHFQQEGLMLQFLETDIQDDALLHSILDVIMRVGRIGARDQLGNFMILQN